MNIGDLKVRQGLPLDAKIILSKSRIKAWYDYFHGNVYVSFSGGKDSTVLLHIVRELYPNVLAVFIDTGLEYPEIKDFVKTIDNVITLKPSMPFHEVIKKYGYPVISKEQAQYINQYRTAKSEKTKNTRWHGDKKGRFKISEKWKFLVNAPFKISEKCCDIMKKNPIKQYEKETGQKPYIGTMASESSLRKSNYIKYGCNAFTSKRPTSQPLSFWTDADIWDYIKKYNLDYSKIYNLGYDRTGCMFCMFGVHLEKCENRFDRMKKTHQKIYNFCMEKLELDKVMRYIQDGKK